MSSRSDGRQATGLWTVAVTPSLEVPALGLGAARLRYRCYGCRALRRHRRGGRDDLRFSVKARGTGQLALVTYLYDRATGANVGGETLRTVDVNTGDWQEFHGIYNCVDDKVLRATVRPPRQR